MIIRPVDPGLVDPHAPPEEILARAVTAALRAPSAFTSRLWQWRLYDGAAALHADPPTRAGTDGRLLVLSCGVALHHARVAVAAAGRRPLVDRFPEPDRPDLLAVLRADGGHDPSPADQRAAAAIWDRRTDGRSGPGVHTDLLDLLRDAAEAEGAHLRVLPGDDAPAGTAVPARGERTARYAVVCTDTDDPRAWLAAGEATSAVLLAATAYGLATEPVGSDDARRYRTGSGHPHLVVRLGRVATEPVLGAGASATRAAR
jgi:nitroreductase